MRPLRYSINVTLDGCCDHREMIPDEDLHLHAARALDEVDALLFGRVTYEMMEAGWRGPAPAGRPEWMNDFARTIDAAKKYVVSSTLERVDWNAQLVRGDLKTAVEALKQQPGKGIMVGGVTLPLALAEVNRVAQGWLPVQRNGSAIREHADSAGEPAVHRQVRREPAARAAIFDGNAERAVKMILRVASHVRAAATPLRSFVRR